MERAIACCGLDCATCDKLENCPTLQMVQQYVPDALANLKSLN